MNKFLRDLSGLASSVALSVCLTGCGTSFAMAPDSSVPFAQGEIDASFEDNGNGTFTVEVNHLGDPAKLMPSATVYVVWIQPKKEGASVQNVGALDVDSDYSGTHEFQTTSKSFEVSITPEASADVLKKSGKDVLKATVSE